MENTLNEAVNNLINEEVRKRIFAYNPVLMDYEPEILLISSLLDVEGLNVKEFIQQYYDAKSSNKQLRERLKNMKEGYDALMEQTDYLRNQLRQDDKDFYDHLDNPLKEEDYDNIHEEESEEV